MDTDKNKIVIYEIDISTLEGRNIVRKLEKHKKLVKLTYPVPFENNRLPDEAFFESKTAAGTAEDTYSVVEVFNELDEKLIEHYENIYKVIDNKPNSAAFTHEEFEKKLKDKFTESYGVNFDDL